MHTVTIDVPEILVDRNHIRSVLLGLVGSEDDAGNDWSWLIEDRVQGSLDTNEFLADMFVLARTPKGVFGEAEIDGRVVHGEMSASEVLLSLVISGPGDGRGHAGWRRPTIAHTDYVYPRQLLPEVGGQSMLELAVETLGLIGNEAKAMLSRLEQPAEGR